MKKYILLYVFTLLFIGCSKNEDGGQALSEQIVGSWSLSGYTPSTKSIIIGDQTVTVSITFTAEGQFQMVQKVGTEAYEKYFEGTYTLQDNVLSGAYSDKTKWGETYTVKIAENTLTMTSSLGDLFNYSRVN